MWVGNKSNQHFKLRYMKYYVEVELNSYHSKWTSNLKSLLLPVRTIQDLLLGKIGAHVVSGAAVFWAMCIFLYDSRIRRLPFRPETSLEITKSKMSADIHLAFKHFSCSLAGGALTHAQSPCRCACFFLISFLTQSPKCFSKYAWVGFYTPNKVLRTVEFHRVSLYGFHAPRTKRNTEVSWPAPCFSLGEGRARENGTHGSAGAVSTGEMSVSLSSWATRGLSRVRPTDCRT